MKTNKRLGVHGFHCLKYVNKVIYHNLSVISNPVDFDTNTEQRFKISSEISITCVDVNDFEFRVNDFSEILFLFIEIIGTLTSKHHAK